MPFHTGLIGKYDKKYYEIYKSPTRGDLRILAGQTEYPQKLRVLLTEEGELYAFTIELLHNLATAELDVEGISVVCFFDEDKMEVADLGDLDVEDMAEAVQRAEEAFRKIGIRDETQVRFLVNQGVWADETYPFIEVLQRIWKK